MKWQSLLLAPFAALALAASQGYAAEKPAAAAVSQQRDPSIAFADSNILDWRADGDSTVYFQDNQRNWYKATLFGPAFDLPYAEAIGIVSDPTGSLDKFGAITVHGRRYAFRDFVRVDGPPTKGGAAKAHGAPKKDAPAATTSPSAKAP